VARPVSAVLPSNVVRLPTAAARQVDNYRYAAQRRAALAARCGSPFPNRHRSPSQREADTVADMLAGVEAGAGIRIVTAVLHALDMEQRRAVVERLAVESLSGAPEARQALAVAKSAAMSIGQQLDLVRALDRKGGLA